MNAVVGCFNIQYPISTSSRLSIPSWIYKHDGLIVKVRYPKLDQKLLACQSCKLSFTSCKWWDLLKLLKQTICDPHHIIVDDHGESEAQAQHPFYQSTLNLQCWINRIIMVKAAHSEMLR